MSTFYIPDANQNPVKLTLQQYMDYLKSNQDFDESLYIIQQDVLPNGKFVSTVLLSAALMDRMYETMVFSDKDSYSDIYCERYSSLADAQAGHQKAIEWVNTLDNNK